MIQVVVGTNHLWQILGSLRGPGFADDLRHTLEPLVGVPILNVNTLGDLKGMTVFDALKDFHNRASDQLKAHPAKIMTARKKEIEQVALKKYNYANFKATIDDALLSVAIHGLSPHGTLYGGKNDEPKFLPDMSFGRRCVGRFAPVGSARYCAVIKGVGELLTFVDSLDTNPTNLKDALWDKLQSLDNILRDIGREDLLRPLFLQLSNGNHVDHAKFLTTLKTNLSTDCNKYEAEVRKSDDNAVCETQYDLFYDWDGSISNYLNSLECHLCDTLYHVYYRALCWEHQKPPDQQDANREVLVIDAIIFGFPAYNSLGRDNAEVPPLANHRLLGGAAIRKGIAKPIVSKLFPIDLWKKFSPSIQHFVLNAAEHAGRKDCPYSYPNMPSRSDMEQVSMGDPGSEIVFADALKKLGLESTFRRNIPKVEEESAVRQEEELGIPPEHQSGPDFPRDWKEPIIELMLALFEGDIEGSVRHQDLLDLYPLHKRVLGLLEHVVKQRKLKDKLLRLTPPPPNHKMKGVSGLWAVAFTGWEEKPKNPKCKCPKCGKNHETATLPAAGTKASTGIKVFPGCVSPAVPYGYDLNASIEVEGHWLIEAHNQLTAGATSLDLAGLLDRLVRNISTAPEVMGICRLDGKPMTLTLRPGNPVEQAQQLASLRQKGIAAAACLTMYLGKIIVSLRNYIEHGHDEVDGACLKIDGSHYWQQERQGKTTYKWVLDTAKIDVKDKVTGKPPWRKQGDLPATPDPPATANTLLLTPASLHRCLVLLTLVLDAGCSHLGI